MNIFQPTPKKEGVQVFEEKAKAGVGSRTIKTHKVSVNVWTGAGGRPQWKVHVTDSATQEMIDYTVEKALETYRRIGRELSA